MERESVTIPQPEVLISHAGFIRAVAQRLLLDDHEVDDVVQQTLLAALEKPPRRALKPWLAAVAKNLARMRRRTEGRLDKRERAAARPEAAPATSDIAERLDMQRRVVDAVTSLEDKYRDVVVLRFFDELPPREIAARLGVPVETVRTRTRRALEQLRGRLDGHPGGRKGWQTALLPLALPPRAAQAAAGTAAAGLLGAIGMKSILALAAALLAAVVLLWHETGTANGDQPRRAGDVRAAEAAGAASDAGAPAVAESDGGGARGTPATPRDFVFRAVVVDPDGEPVRDAKVGGFVRGHNRRPIDARTGPDGEIELDGIAGDRDASLKIEHEDFVPEFAFVPSWSEETARVVLRRGHAFRVKVVSPLGRPVESAPYKASLVQRTIEAWRYWSHDDEGETGAGGFIDFGRIPDAELDITIDDPRYEFFRAEIAAEDVATGLVTIRLAAGGTIEGVVRDPGGEPLAGANVQTEHRSATTGADGRFSIAHVRTDGVTVSADHPDHAPAAFGEAVGWRTSVPVRVGDGALVGGIEIRLAAPTVVKGRIVDEDGQPVRGFEVNSYCSGGYSRTKYPVTGEDGRFTAGPWKIGEPTTWRLQRTKTETHRLPEVREFPIRPGQALDVGDIVVQSRPALRFVVRAPDGAPVRARRKAEVLLTLTKRHEKRAWNDFLFAHRSEYSVRPDGSVELRLDRAVYTVRARAEGGLRSAPVVIDTAAWEGDVVLALKAAVEVSGEVRGAGGAPQAGVRLALLPADAPVPWDPGAADTAITNREGVFRFHVPEPGEYRIGVPQNASNTRQEFSPTPAARRVTVASSPVEGIRFDIVAERRGTARGLRRGRAPNPAALPFVRPLQAALPAAHADDQLLGQGGEVRAGARHPRQLCRDGAGRRLLRGDDEAV